MSSIGLLSVLSLISLCSSSLLLPEKLSILLCKNKCKSYGGCTSVRVDSKHLQCELIFGTENTTHTGEKGIRLFKVQDGNSLGCDRKQRIVNNKRGFPKCVKVASEVHCERVTKKEEPCVKAVTVKPEDERSCILYKKENITVAPKVQLFELPLTLKPGMKLSVCGGSRKGIKLSQFSLTKAPENPRNLFKWFHITLNWRKRKVSFTEGFRTTGYYDGDLPISDITHFTLTVELTQSETKIYGDKILLTTIPLIPVIREFDLRNYYTLHRYAIQKTGEKCEKVNTGIP